MAKKWAEVTSSSQYQALEPEKQEAARQQYFNSVIVPQLPADKVETARKQFDEQYGPKAAVEEKSAGTKLREFLADKLPKAVGAYGRHARDTGEAALKMGTGMVGGVLGDVAGLGVLPTAMAADFVMGGAGESGINPDAVRNKVASALTYEPSNPDSVASKAVELPGKALQWAGDNLVDATGTGNVPLVSDTIRAIPLAVASLAGIKGGKAVMGAGKGPLLPEAPSNMPRPSTVAADAPVQPPIDAAPMPAGQLALPGSAAAQLPARPNMGVAAPAQAAEMGGQPRRTGPAAEPRPEMKSANPPPPEAAPVAPEALPPKGETRKPMKDATPEELYDDAVKTLLENDVQLFKGQRGVGFGAKQLQSAGRAADALLGGSKKKLEQMQDFTAAVFSKVGVKARNATPDAMQDVLRTTEDAYEAAYRDSKVNYDAEFIMDMRDIKSGADMTAAGERVFNSVTDQIRRSLKPGETVVAAEVIEKLRSRLGKINDADGKGVAKEIRDALDAAAERSLPTEKRVALRDARGKFHFMKQMEDAIVHGKQGSYMSPAKLLGVINRKRNKNEAVYGVGDQALVKLAEAGKKVLPDEVGDSGSATRHLDIAKGGAIIADPILATKAGATIFAGRAINQMGSKKGTKSDLAARQVRELRGTSPSRAATQIGVAQSGKETTEDKKRKAQAEALRS